VLVRDGRPVELGESGPLAGAFADADWELTRTPLRTGDVVVLYTDGVHDTVGVGERFGEERLFDLLAQRASSPEALVERVRGALEAFRAGPQADDTAMVVLQVRDAVALSGAVGAEWPGGERVA